MVQNDIPDYFFSEYSDFLEFLPLHFELAEEEEYINNLIETFNINYHYEKFESAFFNLHILYMIAIYSYILKLKNNNLEDFYMSLISLDKNEVKDYQKKFKNKKIKLFDFSNFKERNVFLFFESLGFSEQDIKEISESVEKRNVYAHPRGRIIIKTSTELSSLIQNNIHALNKIHTEINSKVCNLFISFIDKNFDDFEDELNELDELTEKLKIEKSEDNLKLLKSDLNKTNKIIEEKFRDFFIQENFLNRRDVLDCLKITIEEYTTLTRFEEKKKLYEKFKEIFTED
jgi:hypothetical protein